MAGPAGRQPRIDQRAAQRTFARNRQSISLPQGSGIVAGFFPLPRVPAIPAGGRRIAVRDLVGLAGLVASSSLAIAPANAAAAPPAAALNEDMQDIIVTARRRPEAFNHIPVVVSVIGSRAIDRTNTTDLARVTELIPTVIIGAYKSNGGGSIAIRGISSPANQAGFEQSVSVALDGVQASDGHVAQLGLFDIMQVEVLKGPQALLFGKNNTAGVIAVKTRDPTANFQMTASQSYEIVGDETVTMLAASGPLGERLGARLAIRFRYLDGWLRNTALPISSPFYRPSTGAPAGAGQLPGTATPRPGDRELLGRLTLKGDLGTDIMARLKLFGARGRDDGPGVATQNIGPCTGPAPRMYGIADPAAECIADNRTSVGDLPPAIAATMRGANASGKPFGRLSALVASLDLEAHLAPLTLTATTGYFRTRYRFFSGLDQTSFSQLAFTNDQRNRAISQELRVTGSGNGPIDFLLGAYFQASSLRDHNDTKLVDRSYVAAVDRYVSYEDRNQQNGSTLSAFGQILMKIGRTIELAGGARYTYERKRYAKRNLYGIGSFDTLATAYPGSDDPGVLKGRFDDDNISPEATLTWRPAPNLSWFVAYRTGFKSGGFALTSPLQTTTRIGDVDFGSEKVRGSEMGIKGLILGNRLRLGAAVYRYLYTDLQVNSYDPSRLAYTINNAAAVRQYGAELEADLRATKQLKLRGAVAWVRNRFRDFVGQCYGYAVPAGTVPADMAPPPNCSFVDGAGLTLQQDFSGRAPARSPRWSGNAGFEIELPAGDHKIGFTGDAFASSSYFAAETMAPSTRQKGFWRFNASVSIASANDHWTLSFIGRNLTNRYYLLYAADRTGGTGIPGAVGEQRGVVARGREVVLQAAMKIGLVTVLLGATVSYAGSFCGERSSASQQPWMASSSA